MTQKLWRITCEGELYGVERWANVFHVTADEAVNTNDVMSDFDHVYSSAATGGGISWLNPCRGNAGGQVGVHMSRVTMQNVTDHLVPVSLSVTHNGGQNVVGGLPVDVSLVISWTTARSGRSYRGRTYLPPWHENQNDDTLIGPPVPLQATIDGIVVNAEQLLDDLTAHSAALVVYSRTLLASTPITGGYIDSNWDTQRGRSKSQPATRTAFVD